VLLAETVPVGNGQSTGRRIGKMGSVMGGGDDAAVSEHGWCDCPPSVSMGGYDGATALRVFETLNNIETLIN